MNHKQYEPKHTLEPGFNKLKRRRNATHKSQVKVKNVSDTDDKMKLMLGRNKKHDWKKHLGKVEQKIK